MSRLLPGRARSRLGFWVVTTLCLSVLPLLAAGVFQLASWLLPFPMDRLDRRPMSPRVTDRAGGEILALTGRDEQWRFPVPLEQVSPWLIQATIAIEDARFHSHRGIDPWAVGRAAWQDMASGRIISGASTLTMQVCRMMDNRPRTWRAKAVEMFRSLQLERQRDKRWILETYLNLAPYGRNLRGVQAAAWAWFGKPAADLSLAEAALLAGLPQSPSRYRPDRFPQRARARRDAVLRRMADLGMIDERQRQLASDENASCAVAGSHQLFHRKKSPRTFAAGRLALQRRPAGGQTAIDPRLQAELERLALRHVQSLPARTDLAAVILDISSSQVVALLGSVNPDHPVDGQVNGATAWRSPGSALKPFFYAAAFESCRLAPDSTVYDVPIDRAGWSPANFDRTFCNQVSAAEALRRSLNVPAILIAEAVGVSRCIDRMEAAGVLLAPAAPRRAGLSVVVGGAEVRLLDLTNAYATIGRGGIWQWPRLFLDEPIQTRPAFEPNVCAALDDILSSRQRRPAGMEKIAPHDVPWFMWKTGTSSGRRDAWAVGHNRRFAVGVWTGRFSGLGDPDLTGAKAAEPLLARLFDLPALRSARDPAPAQPWLVTHPLAPPAERARAVSIASPRNGATFLALSGRAVIRPRLNRSAEVTWFLNGLRLENEAAARLSLDPGRYELRCVDVAGAASAVRFQVR